jgi:hypothetical protein
MCIDVTYEPLADGTFRLEAPDGVSVETLSPAELSMLVGNLCLAVELLGIEGIRLVVKDPARAESAEDDDAGFEDDLDYVLEKNAELYRRLAR